MATFRVVKESGNFVTVHKGFISDERMSFKAKGILLYLLSRPDDWIVHLSEIQKHAKDGRDSVNNGIKELEQLGYVIRQQTKDEKGKFNNIEYIVFETADGGKAVNGKHVNGKAVNGLSVYGKPVTTNNNNTYNDFNNNDYTNNELYILSDDGKNDDIPFISKVRDIVDYLNSKTNARFSSKAKKTQDLIKARFNEERTVEDFKIVIDYQYSKWINTDYAKYLRPETLFGNKFEGYLNNAIIDKNNKSQNYNPYENLY